ncbi:GNAT family N-acetyltransferase [Catenulispora pinisilvae]|uniref:GNAT family N-acetyltransferase n=1 Tax=Catenulispora pinisilvae TaxID=2705253 RepID=UPI001891CF9D|nr:GNAT family N-acetyltransferase [Catenulispora pinisilvae]
MSDDEGVVRLATAEELAALPALELAADAQLVAYLGGASLPPLPEAAQAVASLAEAAAVLVAGAPPVGFARIDVIDGNAHLEQLSVLPSATRRGIGTALVRACCDWAARNGFGAVTLMTFAHVPFNAPFYARLGFQALDDAQLSAPLAAIRRHEVDLGLDALGPRVAMRRTL